MSMRRLTVIAACLVLAAAVYWMQGYPAGGSIDAHGHIPDAQTAEETRCEPSIPLSIALLPLDKPEAGRWTRFSLSVESGFDPDVIRDMRIEYDFPPEVRMVPALSSGREWLRKAGPSRNELRALIPDERRYALSARVILTLRDGQTVSQSAVRYVDLGEEDPAEGMIGQFTNPDGSSIVVYRGVTVRDAR